ncbi:hypothetical protein BD289DRAFT_441070 [Coniella lustricola]|uniref:Uncharacterized protein n=1 Tax=Coniella lustricola TaxID=2025994 RepID=A0A2T2ZZY2_9PEZI|nr:hypothetical protein BD289DRAFT_441070 [Coniella lustricola]
MRAGSDPGFEPIAIVGVACRLPGEASSLEGLWDLMSNSRTAHGPIPPSRWDSEAWYHPDADHKGTTTTKTGFFLEQDVSQFDAPFFSTTAKEAAGMDPAKRLLLEVAYEAFENAGMSLSHIAGTQTGVYVGSMTSDYELLSTADMMDQPHMAAAGSSEAMTANRLSWFFDLRGPSLTLDTACSSSLYALHLACQSLRLQETSMGLVAGVNLILHPNFMHQLTAMHMLSPDGKSHSFDQRANGYGRGEGVGALVVKRLADAMRDGDSIRAVIRATAANVDGKTPSVTMPSSQAQADLIRTAYQVADLPLEDTQYVELHGTGTPLGDPIEVAAISATFGATRPLDRPIHIGSIKQNIGHVEGCAGIAGILRAVLSVEKGMLLPTAGINVINPKLGLAQKGLAIPTTTTPWPTSGIRRASVNSFGFGGANAHVIIDDATSFLSTQVPNSINGSLDGNPDRFARHDNDQECALTLDGEGENTHAALAHCIPKASKAGQGLRPNEVLQPFDVNKHINDLTTPKILVFSAAEETGLDRLSIAYHNHLTKRFGGEDTIRDQQHSYFESLTWTLAHRRTAFDHRSFIIADSMKGLQSGLENGLAHFRRQQGLMQGTAFVFTGQGAQWAGMGKELLAFPVFSNSIERSNDCLCSMGCAWDLRAELSRPTDSSIDQPAYSQPICTAVQVGLVELLRSWNIQPKAVIGHSSGEIAAAFAAGILTHDDALKVAYLRGVYSDVVAKSPGRGAMMAAGVSESEAESYLSKAHVDDPRGANGCRAVVACINSPNSVTLSGDVDMIDALETLITKDNKFARKLRVNTAYHSPHMRDVASDCLAAMHRAGLSPPGIGPVKMFSSVTGKEIPATQVDATYWIENMCQPVRFSQALEQLLLSSSTRQKQRGSSRPFRKGKAAINWGSIVEVGPHAALKAPINQILVHMNSDNAAHPSYMAPIIRGQDAIQTALHTAGVLWALGNDISLSQINVQSNRSASGSTGDRVSQHPLVDLPAYPWNHSKQYWHEARDTRNDRLRRYPRLDLVGSQIDNTNFYEPQWRNQLAIRDNPWIGDHVITGTTLYPGAGMLIMVIEAAKQIAVSEGRTVSGLEFDNVFFERGLVVPDEGSIETLLSVRWSKTRPSARDFAILSRSTEQWVKHSSGTFTIIHHETALHDPAGSSSSMSLPMDWEHRSEEFRFKQANTPSTVVDVVELYEKLNAVGMEYGPYFQNLASLEVWEGGACFGRVKIPDTKSGMPHGFEYDHVIHPATLDAIFHLALCALAEHGSDFLEAAVPLRLERMFISTDLPRGTGQSFAGFAKRVSSSRSRMEADLIVSDVAWSGPKIIVEGLVVSQVTGGIPREITAMTGREETGENSRCARIAWQLDPTRLSLGTHTFESLPRRFSMVGRSMSDYPTDLQAWIEAECHKSIALRVLLVGTGLSLDVLDQLSPFHQAISLSPYKGFLNFTIGDTSDSSLDAWKAAYTSSKTRGQVSPTFLLVSTDGLNLTKDAELFDVIIMTASETVHPSSERLESAMKPGGRLVLLKELSSPLRDPILGRAHETPTNTGYSVTVKILSKAFVDTTPGPNVAVEKAFLLLPDHEETDSTLGEAVTALATSLERKLEQNHFEVERIHLYNAATILPSRACIISLIDYNSGLVRTWTQDQFNNFKSLVEKVGTMLWLTTGAQMSQSEPAELKSAASIGLLRVLRNEYPQLRLCHLDLSVKCWLKQDVLSSLVFSEWLTAIGLDSDSEGSEHEVAEQDEYLFIPRVVSYNGLDEELAIAGGSAQVLLAPLGTSGQLALAETKLGATHERLAWYPYTPMKGKIDRFQVEIKVKAFSGLLDDYKEASAAAAGHLVAKLGSQAVGIITHLGADIHSHKIGDTVIMYGAKSCKTHMRQHVSMVSALPNSVPVEIAPTVTWLHATAIHVLTRLARLKERDSILITRAGSSTLHRAVLLVAKQMNLRVIASATTQEELESLKAHGICEKDLILLSRSGLKSYIRYITKGEMLSAVIATPTDFSLSREFWPCIAEFGCAVALVSGEHDRNIEIPMDYHPTITFATLDPHQILMERPKAVPRILNHAAGSSFSDCLTACGKPVTFSAGHTQHLLNHLQTLNVDNNIFTVIMKDDELVPVARTEVEPLHLDKDAAYILAGGYGSLGLRLARSMVTHGARRLILLSRSKEASKYQQQISALRNAGAKIDIVKCDIGTLTEVQTVVDDLVRQDIKIKGIIQCAMVLQDGLFANMTFEQWQSAVTPKVEGTMNLHLASEGQPLDFFILLSSVVSIMGNVSQANYAAGNAYMDAFAHYRKSIGLPATSLNIGIVLDSDHIIDGTALDQFLNRFPHFNNIQTTLDEVEKGIIAAMRGTTVDGKPVEAQLVLGMTDSLDPEGVNHWARDSKFIHRYVTAQDSQISQAEESQSQRWRRHFGEANTMQEAAFAAQTILQELVAPGLGILPEDISLDRPLYNVGVDSFKAVEIRNQVFRDFESDLSIFEILSPKSLTEIATLVADRSQILIRKFKINGDPQDEGHVDTTQQLL